MPLEAELIVESPQTLEPQRSGAAFREQLAANDANKGGITPLNVRIILRLTNRGTEPLQILRGGDATQLNLTLEGPGVVSISPHAAVTREYRTGKPELIPAGGSRDLVFSFLGSGRRAMETWHYWTEPGQITLSATYAGQLLDRRHFRISAPPVKVEVVAP